MAEPRRCGGAAVETPRNGALAEAEFETKATDLRIFVRLERSEVFRVFRARNGVLNGPRWGNFATICDMGSERKSVAVAFCGVL